MLSSMTKTCPNYSEFSKLPAGCKVRAGEITYGTIVYNFGQCLNTFLGGECNVHQYFIN